MRSVLFFLSTLMIQSVMPDPLMAAQKLLDIPFSRQDKAYTCGHESLRMVLGYWGKRESLETIMMRIGANGSSTDAIEKIVKKHYPEFKVELVKVDFPSIKKQIDLGRPIMAGTDASFLSYVDYGSSGGHMIIAVGYDDTKKIIFIRDPNSPFIEEMPYEQFKEAVYDHPKAAFVVYKPNVRPPAGPAEHWSKSYPLGTKREEGGIPLAWVVPLIYLSYETEPRLNLSESFEASSKKQNRKFSLMWNGFSYGDQTMEQTPWLGNGKTFRMIGFGSAWVMGRGLKLGANELLSPGIYKFGRHRLFDVHEFVNIKRIPSLTVRTNTIEVAGYVKQKDDESLQYDSLGAEAVSWSGARLGWRRGINPFMGHFSAGISAGKVDIKLDGDKNEIYTTGSLNYDLNLGIFKGSIQTADLARSDGVDEKPHDGFSARAHSLGIDYNISSVWSNLAPINALNYLGFFRPHVEMTHEVVRRTKGESEKTFTKRKWEVELPVPLHYVDMSYGSGITQTFLDSGEKDSHRSTWIRFAFNAYQPWIQLTFGYRADYKRFSELIGQQMSFGLYAGVL
jgi:hypothetical protein